MIEIPNFLAEAIAERAEITLEEAVVKAQTMSREERLQEYLEWNGIVGWTGYILDIVDLPVLPVELRDYQLSPSGFVKNPGKFEGQPLYVPYFYGEMTVGLGFEISGFDESGEGLWQVQFDTLHLDEDEQSWFPELDGVALVIISVDPSGNVSHEVVAFQEEGV